MLELGDEADEQQYEDSDYGSAPLHQGQAQQSSSRALGQCNAVIMLLVRSGGIDAARNLQHNPHC